MEDTGYRDSISEIEKILNKIENGETDIDELAAEIKRAARLLKKCKEKLFDMEQEVASVIKEMED